MIQRRAAPLWSIATMFILLAVAVLLSFSLMNYHPYNYLAFIPWFINIITIPVYWVTGKRVKNEAL
jgi:hypothetical protein